MLVGFAAAVVAAIATRVQLLPEVIDLSLVPTAAGAVGLFAAGCGAALRFPPDRLARITLFGNLMGATIAVTGVLIALALDVLS